jgi:hypoxanthine phosphoribosyltransferase
MTKDYSITMQDQTGRVAVINVNGASIDELVATGATLDFAKECVEDNAYEVAIRWGEIGADGFLIGITA